MTYACTFYSTSQHVRGTGVSSKVDSKDPMICTAATCPCHDSRKVVCRINPYGQCKAKFSYKKNGKVKCKCSYVKLNDVDV